MKVCLQTGNLSSPTGQGGMIGGGKSGDVMGRFDGLTSEVPEFKVSLRFFVDCVAAAGDPALFFPFS